MISKITKSVQQPRTAIENVLSVVISNELSFKIADWGRHRDIEHYVQIDPFEIYWVSPSDICRNTGRKYPPWKNRRQLIGKVKSGDWDRRPPKKGYPEKFEQRTYYRAAELHFNQGVPLDDDQFWRENFPNKRVNRIKYHLKRIDKLVNSIENIGYQTQDELGGYRRDRRLRYGHEILVDIARDGEFLFVDGSHRLTAAKLLGLQEIPVAVGVRHRKWGEKLANNPESLPQDHPDVMQVLR